MMIGISVHPSVRIALCSFFVFGVIHTTRCSSDLTDSLEGRACDENGECLPGYICNDAEICVAKKDGDSENGDVGVDSGFRSDVGGDSQRGFDSSVDTGTDSGSDSGFDSSVDANAESSIPNGDSGDTGSHADAGVDARPCGFEIKPTKTDCPTECETCIDGVCSINCDDERECADTKITCPEGFACDIACSNKQACENAQIVCPTIYTCKVSCTDEQSCKAALIKCGADGPCALDCESGTQTCLDAVIQCKNQACEASCGFEQVPPEIKNCHVSCSSQCGC